MSLARPNRETLSRTSMHIANVLYNAIVVTYSEQSGRNNTKHSKLQTKKKKASQIKILCPKTLQCAIFTPQHTYKI